ncbi:14945_t:CDS:2, partial [Gigaspora rosea]
CRTNLEAELQQRDISGMGMFSEDLYDEVLIELTELIDRISPNDIRELWAVSRIDRQKHHFVIIFAQFHIGILAKRWFNDRVIQKMKRSVMNVQFRLEMVKILHYVKNRSLYSKGFGLMKKVLNLAIETGRTEEMYEIHQELIADMEQQLAEPEGN